MKISNKLYDILKWVAVIALPACIVAYGTIGQAWGWPFIDQIIITATAIETLLGALLGISAITYQNYNSNL